VSDGQWLWAVNDIRPSLIRTESDEATYNLHVLIRFEMETAILSGQMKVGDIPGAWNEKYRKYLGVDVPDHARGCMQDVHWSAGLVGYFPTYTLGTLYAAQFFDKAVADLGGEAAVEEMFGRGEFGPLLGWLREKIHKVGKRVTAGELCKRITGKPLSAEPLLKHLKRKGKEFYGV
jgi:carboxypeptidase Taq